MAIQKVHHLTPYFGCHESSERSYLKLQADGKARFNDRSEQKKNRAEFTAYGNLSIRSSGLLGTSYYEDLFLGYVQVYFRLSPRT